MKTILFSGGGTLGHILPNAVVAEKLKEHNYRVVYLGEKNGMEEKICKRYGIPFYAIKAVKLDRYRLLSNFKIPALLPYSVTKTKKLINNIKPDLIFTKGGYVSLPVVIAGKMLGIKQICHESDASLGIVNKIAYKLNAKVLTSYNCGFSEGKKVGIPLKPEFFIRKSYSPPEKSDKKKPTVLVTGGSQGARSINNFILANCDRILQNYNLIIIGGKTLDLTIDKHNLTLMDYTDKMEKYYSLADIVVARAGATTIAEILALNKKAILIPLPLTVSRGDQRQNAENVASDTVKVIMQEDLEIDNFMNVLDNLQSVTKQEKEFVNPLDGVYEFIVKNLE